MMNSDELKRAFDLALPASLPDNKWNVPDWKCPGDYPKAESTKDWEWRWEFIRRHEDYRGAWQEIENDPDKDKPSDGPSRAELLARRFRLPEPVHPSRRKETYFCGLRMGYDSCSVIPAFSDVADFCADASLRSQYLAAITPTQNLDAQWEHIKAEIVRLNKEWQFSTKIEQNKPRRDKFPLYLRVIDANDNGVSLSQISKVAPRRFKWVA